MILMTGRKARLLTEQHLADQARIARLEADNELKDIALTHDSMTGLFNRDGFEAAWPTELRTPTIDRPRLAIIDANDFKVINDDFGYDVGDEVIRAIGEYLRTVFGVGALIARWGGDEFVVLVAASRLAEVTGLELLVDLTDGPTVEVALSAGVTEAGGRTNERLTKKEANVALRRAKRTGGGVVYFDPDRDPKQVLRERPTIRDRDRTAHGVLNLEVAS